jgi:hypothetical protein
VFTARTGLKFVDRDGLFLSPEKCTEMFAIADARKFNFPDYNATGKLELASQAYRGHIDAILGLDYINVDQIRQKKFKVCLDAVNGKRQRSSARGVRTHEKVLTGGYTHRRRRWTHNDGAAEGVGLYGGGHQPRADRSLCALARAHP